MAMIARLDKLLSAFKDGEDCLDYAKSSIAACIKTGIVTGKANKAIAPTENITRAEVAVIVKGLLQKSNLI